VARARSSPPCSMVLYRPIEAAIRWSGLTRHEPRILEILNGRRLPEADEFPQWPSLRRNAERIYDGILNNELRVAVNGITVQGEAGADPDDPNLTIRHVDLRDWMCRFYPSDRPPFLFSRLERKAAPAISSEAVQALFLEREGLRLYVAQREQGMKRLREQLRDLEQTTQSGAPLGPRSETTYLHILGGLLTLLLGSSPSGQRYSSFTSQEAIISALIAHHGERLGIAERTLQAKFAAAKRSLGK
jgi:hypothetical protein